MSTESATSRSWVDAWIESATAPGGFWTRSRVADHFRTASASALLAEAITTVRATPAHGATSVYEATPAYGATSTCGAVETIVEIGAGDGRLLAQLRGLRPDLQLIGVDVRPRPDELPDRSGIEWHTGTWDVTADRWQGPAARLLSSLDRPTMIICAEWLDDLPCAIARSDLAQPGSASSKSRRGGGAAAEVWREVRVASDGSESPGDQLGDADSDWLTRWWPEHSGRAESGLHRDRAWRSLITALRPVGGLALMIDYGHLREARPRAGSLTGYSSGRQVPPRPDPSVNLTAHVAVDSVAAAGERAGARTALLINQQAALDRFLPAGRTTDQGPSTPLAALQRRGEEHLLRHTLGSHRWLLQTIPRGLGALPSKG